MLDKTQIIYNEPIDSKYNEYIDNIKEQINNRKNIFQIKNLMIILKGNYQIQVKRNFNKN